MCSGKLLEGPGALPGLGTQPALHQCCTSAEGEHELATRRNLPAGVGDQLERSWRHSAFCSRCGDVRGKKLNLLVVINLKAEAFLVCVCACSGRILCHIWFVSHGGGDIVLSAG